MKFGVTELLIILAVVIIVLGPTQIPKLAKMLGKSAKALKDGLGGEDKAEDGGTAAPAQTSDSAKAKDETSSGPNDSKIGDEAK